MSNPRKQIVYKVDEAKDEVEADMDGDEPVHMTGDIIQEKRHIMEGGRHHTRGLQQPN
jgi:hypothetical protein